MLAFHDPLTNLPNRALLKELLEDALVRGAWTETRVGVVFCDLNRSKPINDALGQGEADEILQEVAVRLSDAVRQGDTVSRYGGDEFVVLLPGIHARTEVELLAAVDKVAARLQLILCKPVEVNGRKIFLDVAIGAVVSDGPPPTSEGLAKAANDLIERAVLATYTSEAQSRGHMDREMNSPYIQPQLSSSKSPKFK